ncbi:MAG: hypothetical protein ABR526_07200 [Chthoniobacterales bacterium]
MSLLGCSKHDTTIAPLTTKPYQLGTKVEFGLGGDGLPYMTAGWSSPEANHTWTEGGAAVVTLPIEPANGSLILRMQLSGLTKAPELPFQAVELLANGIKVGDWQVGTDAEYTSEIPLELVRAGGPLRIEMKIANATTPKKLGIGADERALGVALHSLRLDRKP